MSKDNLENVLNQQNPSNRNKEYYDMKINFHSFIITHQITFTFGDSHYGASFDYQNEKYVIDNGNYFDVENCIFQDDVIVHINDPRSNIKFVNCIFEKNLIIKSFSNERLERISSFILKGGKVNNFIVENVTANYKFYINPQEKFYKEKISITNLQICDSKFMENFKLQNTIINEINISDVNFEKNVDFYKTIFKNGISYDLITNEKSLRDEIRFSSINFSGMALFTNSRFEQKFIMEYVTFEKVSNFKNAIFEKGLDLEQINTKEEINFHGIEILDKTTTSQETYRILKHNFEKVNNKIEANKYHALELDQRKKELEKDKLRNFWEYLVFQTHSISSKHSTSYIRALAWIFVVSFVTNFFLGNNSFDFSVNGWDNIFKYINILSKIEDFNCSYLAMSFNKIFLGYLYYQFVTAVRKDTRK